MNCLLVNEKAMNGGDLQRNEADKLTSRKHNESCELEMFHNTSPGGQEEASSPGAHLVLQWTIARA